VVIFGRTKHGVEKLSEEAFKRGFKAEAIHGNKPLTTPEGTRCIQNKQGNILVAPTSLPAG